jgi:hypothetical protein
MNFDPWRCEDCGGVETEEERELDKDCRCGGRFKPVPWVFVEKPVKKSSTHILTEVPGTIACQGCGCRDRSVKDGCEYVCHKS